MHEFFHQLRIARNDHHQIVTVILHGLKQGVHGLLPVIILAMVGQGIGFVHKKHTAQRLLDDFTGFDGGLSHIARHQPAAIHFHQMPFGEDAQAAVNAAHQPGNHRFAGAGVAAENHVQREFFHRQVVLLAQLLHRHQIDEALHLFFNHG